MHAAPIDRGKMSAVLWLTALGRRNKYAHGKAIHKPWESGQ
ncbi:hypothetical protein GPLA_0951 [Paraglaciecola polaris LMG 21857]|uniref:Uncharacterized protein n=1 Tax=Paraglaciecola polaris LMG 21857 TaxID=1129793 RepID=K6ZNK7_9ALTE|nr:hypothetical protein GPLA_0951 [Paraglaciecola polaris LMG 21857]